MSEDKGDLHIEEILQAPEVVKTGEQFVEGSKIPSEEISDGLTLSEPLPVYQHLTIAEIQDIASHRLGLRATRPTEVEDEFVNGTVGDMLLIHNVGDFLDFGEEQVRKLEHGKDIDFPLHPDLKRSIINAVFIGQSTLLSADDLGGIEELPGNYEEALTRFYKERAQRAFSQQYQVTPEMSLRDYINRLTECTPAFMVVRDTSLGIGYDHDLSFGFGKRGRRAIPSENTLVFGILGHEDVTLLTDRYANYLNDPAGKKGFNSNNVN